MSTSAKYPRIPHFMWSHSPTGDDKVLGNADHFVGQEVVVTEKLDGENQTWTHEAVYARSHDCPPGHASNSLSKQLWSQSRHLIDPHLSVFFEYTYALHSIWYRRMAAEYAYIHIFGVRDDRTGIQWSWEDVEMMAEHLGYPTVPVLWTGTVSHAGQLEVLAPGGGPSAWTGVPIQADRGQISLAPGVTPDANMREGEVVRLAGAFEDPQVAIAKSVRPHHVQSDEHWKRYWKPMHGWKP